MSSCQFCTDRYCAVSALAQLDALTWDRATCAHKIATQTPQVDRWQWSIDSNVYGCLYVFSMQNKVPIVSELPHFAREEGNSPSRTHPLLGSTILQILATPLMYSVEPWCVLWKCKITPINFCPLNRSDSRCLDLGIPMVYIRDDLSIHNPNTMWSAAQTGDQYCLTILHHCR